MLSTIPIQPNAIIMPPIIPPEVAVPPVISHIGPCRPHAPVLSKTFLDGSGGDTFRLSNYLPQSSWAPL